MENEVNCNENKASLPVGWVDGSVVSEVIVEFTTRSFHQLSQFHSKTFHVNENNRNSQCKHCFNLFHDYNEAKEAIINLLKADPRSVYRRKKCVDRLYYFILDTIHITAWFDIDTNLVEVVKVKPYFGNKEEII